MTLDAAKLEEMIRKIKCFLGFHPMPSYEQWCNENPFLRKKKLNTPEQSKLWCKLTCDSINSYFDKCKHCGRAM